MANANLAREETTSNMDTSVDIQRLVTCMREKVDNLSPLSPKCCIFRVPKRLRQVNERAYTPFLVSIGPLHHGRDDLKPLEEHKWRYLKDFLQHSQKPLEYLVAFIKEREESIRECYAETIIFDSDKFVEIILVDAAFIIEVLLKNMYSNLITSGDRIFEKPMVILDIFQDFLLLENQLPFFVLDELFEMAKAVVGSDENELTPTFIGFACKFLVGFDRLEDKIPEDIDSTRVKHFVDLFSNLLAPRERSHPHKWGKELVKTPTAKELHDAGIKFKASSSNIPFDIRFMSGVLEIPKLVISDKTESQVRNIVAFERCLYNECYMTQYVWFLNNLINSSKDVEYLVESGIIEQWIELSEELNDYCKKPWHKWEATLRRDYFKTPWRVISIFAAVILLSLTFIQTMYSIVSVNLFEMAKVVFGSQENESTPTIIDFVYDFLVPFNEINDKIPEDIDSTEVKHFVDLMSNFLTPREHSQPHKWRKGPVKIPPAKELHDAGIKFKANSSKNLFDIRFTNGVLEIPQLFISDRTEGWLQNLVAFEQCLYNECYMTRYVRFLDNLVDSAKDVEYLVESGVITNWLADNHDVSYPPVEGQLET
ncbi:hypothetical protein Acr_00g0039210 [Actinidia rufa]|uniref:Transmembrane protein n=1 Tax=Actinidia rufa TaxID=165716 RepID=A0A7J0DHD0_9ERIC|nr:hypothetical protein Acr_00g0039210 [Actinidia rufa]